MDCPTCGKSLSTRQGMRQHHTKVHGDPLLNRECSDCGERFYDPKSRRTYCDDCYTGAGEQNGNHSDARESAECERCGDTFQYYPSNKDGVYCPSCVANADGVLPQGESDVSEIEIECEHCNSTLQRYPWRVDSASYGSFCNLDCYGEWLSENVVGESHHQWAGGEFPYGSSWWGVRRAALERDDYECQNCGAGLDELGRKPDVHHIERVRSFENPEDAHYMENVVCLCRSCHRRIEEGDIELSAGSW